MNSRYLALAVLALVATLSKPDEASAAEVTGKTLQADFLVMVSFVPFHFKQINMFYGRDQAYDYSNSQPDKGTIIPINKQYTAANGDIRSNIVRNNRIEWRSKSTEATVITEFIISGSRCSIKSKTIYHSGARRGVENNRVTVEYCRVAPGHVKPTL